MDPSTADFASPDAAPDSAATASAASDGLRSFRRYTYWSLVTAAFALLALPMITGPVPFPPDPLGTFSLAGLVVVVAAVTRLTERHVRRTPTAAPPSVRQWRAWAIIGGLGAIAVATAAVVAGDDLLWAFAPAMIVSLLIAALPRRSRPMAVVSAIGVAAAAGVAISLLRGDHPLAAFPLTGALVTAFVLFLTLASIWTWDVAAQLDAARRKAATLAVANERLRFASDLHDIQGHHLQVIALKSELASRRLREDPDAAELEMSAVQELAADALRDTRAVVHGYRRATLDAELANASGVLASAGIDARLRLDEDVRADTLPATTRQLLGLVLREAVTNILRHSAASRAEVTLTRDERARLTVSNDGVDRKGTAPSGGLGDLAERLRAAGGALSWQRTGDRFEVRAELPADPAPESGSHPRPGPGPQSGSAPWAAPEDST